MATTRGVTSPAPSHSPTPSVRPPGDRQFPAGGELAHSPSLASPGPDVERAAGGRGIYIVLKCKHILGKDGIIAIWAKMQRRTGY